MPPDVTQRIQNRTYWVLSPSSTNNFLDDSNVIIPPGVQNQKPRTPEVLCFSLSPSPLSKKLLCALISAALYVFPCSYALLIPTLYPQEVSSISPGSLHAGWGGGGGRKLTSCLPLSLFPTSKESDLSKMQISSLSLSFLRSFTDSLREAQAQQGL